MTRHIAKVISIADEDEHGKVQVRIFPELTDVADGSLPWACPESIEQFGTVIGSGSHSVPLVGSFIYVDVSDDWTTFSYTRIAPYVTDIYPYADAVQTLKDTVSELGEQTYPQPNLTQTPDGTITFHNTDTNEQGMVFPSGMYVVIGTDGILTVKDAKLSLVYTPSDGKLIVSADMIQLGEDSDKVQIGEGGDSTVLYSPLNDVLTKLLNHTHVAPTGPTTPAQEPSGTPLSSRSGKLQAMKSTRATSD